MKISTLILVSICVVGLFSLTFLPYFNLVLHNWLLFLCLQVIVGLLLFRPWLSLMAIICLAYGLYSRFTGNELVAEIAGNTAFVFVLLAILRTIYDNRHKI